MKNGFEVDHDKNREELILVQKDNGLRIVLREG